MSTVPQRIAKGGRLGYILGLAATIAIASAALPSPAGAADPVSPKRQVAEATEDARTSAAIKAQLALDPNLSALDISVDTTDGVVTLAGKVDSPDAVARAMELALEHDNVREVISTLQVVRPTASR